MHVNNRPTGSGCGHPLREERGNIAFCARCGISLNDNADMEYTPGILYESYTPIRIGIDVREEVNPFQL